MKLSKRMGWAVKWTSRCRLDGLRRHFLGEWRDSFPSYLSGYGPAVFKTRAAAREWASVHYGYIAKRPDLKAEPHGWEVPKVVRVEVTVRERQGSK